MLDDDLRAKGYSRHRLFLGKSEFSEAYSLRMGRCRIALEGGRDVSVEDVAWISRVRNAHDCIWRKIMCQRMFSSSKSSTRQIWHGRFLRHTIVTWRGMLKWWFGLADRKRSLLLNIGE